MAHGPEILLTNDDGIESPGLRAMADSLASVGQVTVVAPATDQSATGRSISYEVTVSDHQLGYAVDGTPADCVVAGLAELTPDADVVVAGCNWGGNLGAYALGRSGTIGAAIEASFFGVPSIATSLYLPALDDRSYRDYDLDVTSFTDATAITRFLVDRGLESDLFDGTAYLNVNVPFADTAVSGVEITVPANRYEMDAEREGETVHLRDRVWERMRPDTIPDPEGTDRRAVVEGRISVTPLTPPHAIGNTEELDRVLEDFGSEPAVSARD